MQQPGLDNRHRDRDGRISKKHGNTLISTLRKQYGAGFAKHFRDDQTLGEVLHAIDDESFAMLRAD